MSCPLEFYLFLSPRLVVRRSACCSAAIALVLLNPNSLPGLAFPFILELVDGATEAFSMERVKPSVLE